MTPKDHNRLVGIFLMIHGGLQSLVMVLLALIYGGIGLGLILGGDHGEDMSVGIAFIVVIAIIFVIAAVFFLPQIIGGWKLYKERPDGRTWGVIGSILACISFPLGTAAGVYGLWFLFGNEGKQFYLGGQPQFQQIAPKPGGWQQ